MDQTCIFFLTAAGKIERVPQQAYVRLLRGQARVPEYAGQRVRVVDFYVERPDKGGLRIDNAIYSYLHFDGQGGVDREALRTTDAGWLPTEREVQELMQRIRQQAECYA